MILHLLISDPTLYLGELHLFKIMESLIVEISYSPTNGGNELNLIERDRNLYAGAYDLCLEKYSLVPFGCHIKLNGPIVFNITFGLLFFIF